MIALSKAIAARMRLAARRISGDESGTATLEFVIIVPVFLTIFMSAFEAGLLMTRQVMLERGMDMSIRNLRLGSWTDPTHDMLKTEICRIAAIIPDCMDTVMLELRPISTTTWNFLSADATCVERDEPIQPVTEFNVGIENEMMLVRACAIFDPIFPMTGLGLNLPTDSGGAYALIASSAFVNEPD